MDIQKFIQEAREAISCAKDTKTLEELRVKYLGRSSPLSNLLRSIKTASLQERRRVGGSANEAKQVISAALAERHTALGRPSGGDESFDVSRPGRKFPKGHVHLITQAQEQIAEIFSAMGFEVLEGPELETEFYNFDALNIPADHPAREMQDTFWLKESKNLKPQAPNPKLLLRTHTSPMQVRYMEKHEPPLRVIVPGVVYRHEATDVTHEFQYHQVEGLMVGKDVSLAHLKGVMEYFFRQFFKDEKIEVRFRASYFPFTEPSVEVVIKGTSGKLKGQWLEVAGAGMVHQNVFKAAGYSSGAWQGFAFGAGIERLVMLKHKIDDVRLFNSGDLRFVRQF